MRDSKEQIIDKAVAAMRQDIEENYSTLEALYGKRGITIDSLEEKMGELRHRNEATIEQMYNEIANSLPEKAMIRKKKPNSET